MKIRFTFWKTVFLFLMAAGFYATVVRFTQGLGRSTSLSDQFPWGIWIGFDVLCDAGRWRFHANCRCTHFQHQAAAPDRAPHDFDGLAGIPAGLRSPDVRPWTAIAHLASADHAEPALGDVRGGVLRDAIHGGPGAGVLAHCAGAFQPAETAKAHSRGADPTGDRRGNPLHAAPVVAGHVVPDHAGKAASFLVQPSAAGVLLHFRDRGRTGDDYLRVVHELQAFRTSTGTAHPAGVGAGFGSCAVGIRDSALRRPGAPRRAQTRAASGLRNVPLLAGDLGLALPLILLSRRKVRTSAGGLYVAAVLGVLGFLTNPLNV